jgi:hypothetical protein
MSKVIELASYTILAGVAAIAAARTRNLSPLQTTLSFPLGMAVFLLMQFRSNGGES